jgi:hypothetical protein
VRFGRTPDEAALDPFCRAFDHGNLFVMDGSFWPSSAALNPALTIAAQALRVADRHRSFLETTRVNEVTRTKLEGVSTATVASALYKRGLHPTVTEVRSLAAPPNGSMVGEAFTLRYIAAREDLNPMTVFRDHNAPSTPSD